MELKTRTETIGRYLYLFVEIYKLDNTPKPRQMGIRRFQYIQFV